MKIRLFALIARCFVLFALVLSFVGTGKAQYLFNEMTGSRAPWPATDYYGAGNGLVWYTQGMAQGDFNGDGRLDLVALEEILAPCGGSTDIDCYLVQVYLAQPDGSFAAQPAQLVPGDGSYPSGIGNTIQVADVNGDGKLDLVYSVTFNGAAGYPCAIVVQLGNGDGTFQPAVVTTTPAYSPQTIAIADFNGDGKPDVAVTDSASPNLNTVYVQMGNGDGSFQPGVPYVVPGVPWQVSAAVLRKNGKADLAVGTNQGAFILLNNGDGTFGTPVSYATNGTFVGFADMNSDGIQDLLVIGNDPTSYVTQGLNVFLGNGDGTFGASTFTAITGNLGGNILMADFNGDGAMDVATGGGWTGIVVLIGNNDGTFKAPTTYGDFEDASYGTLLAGDYTGDGKVDLVSAPYLFTGSVFTVLANNGDGTFAAGSDISVANNAQIVTAGDFNGDGIQDLAVATGSGFNVYLGNGDGTYKPPVNSPGGATPTAILARDFNGDGKLDLAVANSTGTVSIYLGVGNGTFSPSTNYPIGPGATGIATGDFNKDGKPDLAISDGGDSNVSVLLGNGEGTFQPASFWNTGVGGPATTGPSSISVADFNGDGSSDIVIGSYSVVSVLLANGDGTFQAPALLPIATHPPYTIYWDPSAVVTASLRNNGIMDIVASVANASGGFYVYLGNGDGTFSAPELNWGGLGYRFAIGDFNGDGFPDLATCGENSAIGVSLGIGDGTFQPQRMYNIPRSTENAYCSSLAVADFNGDGLPDITALTYNLSGSPVTVSTNLTMLLSNPVPVFSASNLSFGTTNVGSSAGPMSMTVTNQSYTTMAIASVGIAGANAGDFTETTTCGNTLASGANCSVSVTFSPTAGGARSASLTIADNSAVSPHAISLSGTGNQTVLPVAPTITWAPPAAISYGTALGAAQLNATANVPGTFAYAPALGTILSAGSQVLSVTFTPTDLVHYTTATSTVRLVVSPGAVAIAWTSPAAITYGTALSVPQLDATANIPGTFMYAPAPGTVLKAGTQTLSVTFTPTDAIDYASATSTVSLIVNPATPTVTWPIPAVTYGVPLSASQLNATSTVPGTFTYTPAAGAVLKAGQQTLSVAFSPTDSTDYSSATTVIPVVVSPALLTITANPASMTYGASVPSLTATITGFVNGDTQSGAVTGTPAMTTTATNTSAVGSYTIVASQGSLAAANYSFAFVNNTLAIGKATLLVTAQNASKVYGASLPGLSYSLTGFVNGDSAAAVSGSPALSTTASTASAVGSYPITASAGSLAAVNYTFAFSPGTLSVTKATSVLGLTSSVNPSTSGQSVTFTANVAPQAGGTTTGSVSFYDGTTLLRTVAVSGNTAGLITSALAPGSHTVAATYGGDTNVSASSSPTLVQTVTASSYASTTTLTSSSNPGYVTQPITYTALVASLEGIPGGSVEFKQGTATIATVPLVGGVATYTAIYSTAGSRSITALYPGSASFTASTSPSLTQAVHNLPASTTTVVTTSGSPSFVGQSVTFTTTVSSSLGEVTDGVAVTFTDGGGALIGTATTTRGVASISTSALTAGNHPIRATYAGNATYARSISSAITQVVDRHATTVVVESNANPSSYGQPVTLTATVNSAGPATPTGTVTFKDGTANLATVALVNGIAAVTRSNLIAGTHSIMATYNGNATNATGTSTVLEQQVNQASTTAVLRTSLNPAHVGQTVRFTVAITSSTGATPGGSVTFTAGSLVLGTATLAGGTGSLTTASLPAGTTAITVAYSGNSNMEASSAALNETFQ